MTTDVIIVINQDMVFLYLQTEHEIIFKPFFAKSASLVRIKSHHISKIIVRMFEKLVWVFI